MYATGLLEIARQVAVDNPERGQLLRKTAQEYIELLRSVVRKLNESRAELEAHQHEGVPFCVIWLIDAAEQVLGSLRTSAREQREELARLEASNSRTLNAVSCYRVLCAARAAELRAVNDSIMLLTSALQRLGMYRRLLDKADQQILTGSTQKECS